jgi:hypothetical protein
VERVETASKNPANLPRVMLDECGDDRETTVANIVVHRGATLRLVHCVSLRYKESAPAALVTAEGVTGGGSSDA